MAGQPAPSSETDKKLPSGMVLGPDGKPCKVCGAFRAWKPHTNTSGQPTNTDREPGAGAGALASGGAALAAGRRAECPPDGAQLGAATWTFLHTAAAYYPARPSALQRAHMLGLLHALPALYPCAHCAAHLGEAMRAAPPDVSGRAALGRWLCERHNEVNERLGKGVFDCGRVDERWRDGPGDGSCD